MDNRTSPHRTLLLTISIFAAILMTGCSGYNRLLKSGDPELLYDKALEYYEAEKYQRTITLLGMIGHYYYSSERADSIAYYYATSHYKIGDFETSGILMDDFRQTYPLSPFLEDVEFMLALGYYFMSPKPERDQTATIRALMAIDEFMERYPGSIKSEALGENLDELNQKLHDKTYINAKTYYNIGKYKAAVVALKNALNRYPESNHREELMYLSVKSRFLLASNSLQELQRDRYLDMMDSYYSFIMEYPESSYLKELDKMQETAKKFTARFSDLEPDAVIEIIEE